MQNISRRDFLKQTGLATMSMMLPGFLQGTSFKRLYGSRAGKVLVVIQLSGGNDGLNTIIPYRNDLYHKYRPRLRYKADEVIRLSDEQGLHPSLAPLQALYDQGRMAILNGVGYPEPVRSHFRSMDIWHTASGSRDYRTSGWLGRYLDVQAEAPPYHALEMDDTLSLALKGDTRDGFATRRLEQLKRVAHHPYFAAVADHADEHHHAQADYLYRVMAETQSSAAYLYSQAKQRRDRGSYPRERFGNDLRRVADLIMADTDTRIYYVTLDGFDTHANQRNKQARLLKQYAEAVCAFTDDLAANGLLDDTLIMTFSEFGRRVKQNGSGGTDHGTANNVWLIGGGLQKAGFYNDAPILTDLDEGDLKYTVDFRRVYSDILTKWLEADASAVLGGSFEGLGLL